MMDGLLLGLGAALSFQNLLMVVAGVLIGTYIDHHKQIPRIRIR